MKCKVILAALIVTLLSHTSLSKTDIPTNASDVRMYVMVTPSHERYFNEWFKPTLQDNYNLLVTRCDQGEFDGVHCHRGWTKIILHKIDMIIQAIKENWGSVFVYSDVDIQFFRPTWPTLAKGIRTCDMLMQKESKVRQKDGCTGFFACVGNKRTLRTWEIVRERLIQRVEVGRESCDQRCFNDVMKKNPTQLKISFLPNTFMNGGTFTGRLWHLNTPLFVPTNIILHHANFVLASNQRKQIDVKIAQLKYVRNKYNARFKTPHTKEKKI